MDLARAAEHHERYRALRLIAAIIRILAILVAVLGGLGVIIGAIVTLSGDGGVRPALLVLVGGALYVAVISLFLFAYGEIIRLVIAVEDNTRLTAEALAAGQHAVVWLETKLPIARANVGEL